MGSLRPLLGQKSELGLEVGEVLDEGVDRGAVAGFSLGAGELASSSSHRSASLAVFLMVWSSSAGMGLGRWTDELGGCRPGDEPMR